MKSIEEIYAMNIDEYDEWFCNELDVVEYQKLIVNNMVFEDCVYTNLEERSSRNSSWQEATDEFLDFGNKRYRIVPPPKEPTYTELQAKWIAENNVKVGDEVRYDGDGKSYTIDLIYDGEIMISNYNGDEIVEYTDLILMPKQPAYIPFKFEDWQEFIGKPVKHRKSSWWSSIHKFNKNAVSMENLDNCFTYAEMLDIFEILRPDGSITPFGKVKK